MTKREEGRGFFTSDGLSETFLSEGATRACLNNLSAMNRGKTREGLQENAWSDLSYWLTGGCQFFIDLVISSTSAQVKWTASQCASGQMDIRQCTCKGGNRAEAHTSSNADEFQVT